jgi:Ca2+/H+ antiporter
MGPGISNAAAILAWTMLPALISLGIAIFLIVLAYRLVRAVEKIADKIG